MMDSSQRMKPEYAERLRQSALLLGIFLSGGGFFFPRVPLAIALIAICFVLKGMTFGFRREMAGSFVLMIATFAVAISGSGQFITESIVVRFTNFALGMILLGMYLDQPWRKMADDVYPILKIMAWQAIITVVLGTFVPGLFRTVDLQETIYHTIFWVFTYHSTIQDASGLARADGFFWEPGVFQLYLNIFVYLSAFVYRSTKNVVLGIFGVLATQSTTGLVLAAILAGYYYLQNMRTLPFPTKLLITALAPVILVPLMLVVIANVNNKVSGDSKGSAWARSYDFNTGVAVLIKYPLFGIGFDYSSYHREANLVGDKDTFLDADAVIGRGNSNGIVSALYSIGIPLGLVFFFGLFKQGFVPNRPLFAVVLFTSLFTEAIFFTPFILMLTFSGLLLRSRIMSATAAPSISAHC